MLLIPLLLLLAGCTCVPLHDGVQDSCGYESCTDAEAGVLNVHIVPHTHDDVGWLKTVDQYYYGSRDNIQKAGVQYILDSVIKELWEDPKRKFMYVETAFFWKWWIRQKDSVRHKVHVLVRQGRLQFVGGAWSMNDEAASHYHSTVDQFTRGLNLLNKTFGHCGIPKVGWQIDPFGHSREFASLLAGMGYDGLFLGRIDYQDKANRKIKRSMEVLWRGDDDLGKPSDIFTGVLYNTYSPPPGFCFDILCSDEPIIDDPSSPMYNVETRISDFLAYVEGQALFYRTNNVIVTMGGDFTYQDAATWYINLDKLIEYTNLKAAKDGLNIKLFYSTPNCYLKAVKDAKPKLTTKSDDFFPYASDPNSYWTGYFTSRPTTKYFEREGNNYLQTVKQLQVLTNLEEHNKFVIDELRDAMGVWQHHDAITGTEKQHVTSDYVRMLNLAIDDALLVARQAFNKINQGDALKPPLLTYDRCHLNESSCHTSETSQSFVITIYNPIAWTIPVAPIRIPVVNGDYTVYDSTGAVVPHQIVPLSPPVLKIPTRASSATKEVVFFARDLPALGTLAFYVTNIGENEIDGKNHKITKRETEEMPSIDELFDDVRIKTNEVINLEDIPKELVDKLTKKTEENQEKERKIIKENANYENMRINIEKDLNFDILTDKKDGFDRNVQELIRTVKVSSGPYKTVDFKKSAKEMKYPNLNDDEMRMLGDDPQIVTKQDDVLGAESTRLRINESTGEIISVFQDGVESGLTIRMLYYPGCTGPNTEPRLRSSGAYIFRPNATQPFQLTANTTHIIKGSIVDEIHYSASYSSGIVRIYKDKNLNFIENDWIVGPIPIEDNIGKEIVFRYETDILNNGEFYTDSNGRQMLKRKLNKRYDYNVTLAEPVAGNYYPITNRIFIRDGAKKLTVLTDRSEGGSSLIEGSIELMVHRRLLHDDAFGVGEALNETANKQGLVVRGRHRILVTSLDEVSSIDERKKVLEFHLQPQIFVSNAKSLSLKQWLGLKSNFSPLKNDMPRGIHLLTLEPWDGKILIRFENYLEKTDTNNTVTLNINDIFKNVNIKSYRETTLAANQWLDELKTWEWNSDFQDGETVIDVKNDSDSSNIVLKPKQIRTFVVDYSFSL